MKGLPYEVRSLLEKARESATLAVETYNRPSAMFRSGAYVVLMIIAWTSLFHAICLRKKIKPFYRQQNSKRYERIDGRPKRWELSECLLRHFGGDNNPVRRNLEFFIGLRNQIEHCTLSKLDAEIFGECQALFLNFEAMLTSEFGEHYAVSGGLSFTIQFSGRASQGHASAANRSHVRTFREVKRYIDQFRSSLTTDVQTDLQYSFKVFLVPKIGNHATSDSVAVEFVKFDPSNAAEMAKYEQLSVMIKPKEVGVANHGLLKPSEVVFQVAKAISRPFSQFDHKLCYLNYQVRPSGGSSTPAACDPKYCQYDAVHKDYSFRPAWVSFLINELKDESKFKSVITSQKRKQ